MRVVRFEDARLDDYWVDDDPTIRQRSGFLTHWMAGARSSAAVLFELEPGASFGRHRHSAEETIVVMEGEVEVRVGDETAEIRGGGLVVAPAGVRHDIRCIGDTTARCVGFWSAASVVSLYDKPMQPINRRRAGTPVPEDV